MTSAQSFSFAGEDPEKAARAFVQAARRVTRPSGAVIFAAGSVGERVLELGRAVAQSMPGLPVCLASGAGVVSERGEVEGQSAATGIVWSGGKAEPFSVTGNNVEAVGSQLSSAIRPSEAAGRNLTALVFARPNGLAPHVLEPLSELRRTRVLGAGTVGDAPIVCVAQDGVVSSGPAGGMVLSGITMPLVRASAACRLLMPLKTITKTRGSMVLEIEGAPALEVLSSVADNLEDQPLVFVALAPPVRDDPVTTDPALERRLEQRHSERPPERPEVLIRAVQGVDPVRRGLLVSDEVRPGMRLAFAVRDAKAAREDLQTAVRELLREANGAAPRFGIYINCAGRGSSLYGQKDVDLKILKARLGELPLAGMQSSFEVSEVAGKPALQLYTGIVGIFTSPS
ncbi:MAG TPA: FIST C-terminal domain-containing protein [Polyangiaceae bacterium]|nr:FIST C-terminal domain-containing protein [Polyangiaceae bacterium]